MRSLRPAAPLYSFLPVGCPMTQAESCAGPGPAPAARRSRVPGTAHWRNPTAVWLLGMSSLGSGGERLPMWPPQEDGWRCSGGEELEPEPSKGLSKINVVTEKVVQNGEVDAGASGFE